MPTQSITIGNAAQAAADQVFDGVFERSLNFAVELEFEQARHFIRRINQYNDFHFARVLDALDAIDRLIPRYRYGAENPNDGRRNYRLKVGREGSPVLYLERHEWGNDERLTDDGMAMIRNAMHTIALADEADVDVEPFDVDGRRIVFRFWWD